MAVTGNGIRAVCGTVVPNKDILGSNPSSHSKIIKMKFRTTTFQDVELIPHIVSEFSKSQLDAIHIGTDSISIGGTLTYFTVVAFRYRNIFGTGKGAHYIFKKTQFPTYRKEGGKPDLYLKLWKEVELTIECAQFIVDNLPVAKDKIVLEFDFNNIIETVSTKLIPASHGWALSMGLKSLFKSDEQLAVKAANHKCQSQ